MVKGPWVPGWSKASKWEKKAWPGQKAAAAGVQEAAFVGAQTVKG